MKFNNRTYDILKWVAMVVLPAFIVCFKGIGRTVDFELTDVIAEILIYINGFLGAILGVSTANYNEDTTQH